jgi:hypothetical protein
VKRESIAVINNVQRKRVLYALDVKERNTLELAADLNIESSEMIRVVHDMCLRRLIRQRPLSARAKKRYKEMHDVLRWLSLLERRKKLVQKFIGRAALPGCRTVKIHPHDQSIVQSPLEDSICRRMLP